MATYHVTCINKSDRTSRHERIRNIGGLGWQHTQQNAIVWIEAGINDYYTTAPGYRAKVIVAKTPEGHKYLKTDADTTTKDNLLSLPECL